ncbi:MAG TPA: HIT domain-containing protein [Terriglobales bacterium]|nr:HIT domain-containing protein [Terriglobales bacterium]
MFFGTRDLLTSATLNRMDYLWTPWRYAYVAGARKPAGCIFCEAPKQPDAEAGIVHRASLCYVILNAFPYTSGHVMVVPYQHVDELQKLDSAAAREMMDVGRRMEGVLRQVYRPDGINLGMNIGQAAGAGVADHIHMHLLPRWSADTNFMTTAAETRVLPEALETTYQRLREKLES